MSIYEFIPKDRYISRSELVAITGLSDRIVRLKISEIRKRPDTVIISSSHGKGYKRPSTVAELESCLRESISRVKHEEAKQVAIRKRMREMTSAGEQMTFDFGG